MAPRLTGIKKGNLNMFSSVQPTKISEDEFTSGVKFVFTISQGQGDKIQAQLHLPQPPNQAHHQGQEADHAPRSEGDAQVSRKERKVEGVWAAVEDSIQRYWRFLRLTC